MRRYDTTFILNPQIGDEAIEAGIKEITDIISSSNGQVQRENRIGSRRLAYDIGRHSHGYYVCLIHDSDENIVEKLEKHFKLGDNFLRHLTIRYDGDPFRKSVTEVMLTHESERRARLEQAGGSSDDDDDDDRFDGRRGGGRYDRDDRDDRRPSRGGRGRYSDDD